MKRQSRKSESGVALLMALFALMLLTGIAFTLLFLSDTETSINRNYREQQRAYFAVQAGLAEVRERLTTSNAPPHLIVGPTQMPPLANSVMYVINPAGGAEVVAPNSAANRYFDTELCHEGLTGLNLTDPGAGVPCPSPSTVPGVYAPFIDSDSPFSTTTSALNFKWVRITQKANATAAPFYVDGGGSALTYPTQICWDGMRERLRPALYPTCASDPPPPEFLHMRDVHILTALAVTSTGARRMAQMEVAHDPPMVTNAAVDSQDHVSLSGALTVNGFDYCSCECTKDAKTKVTTCVSRPGKVCDDDKWAIYSSETVDNPNASEVIIAGQSPAIAQNQPWFYDIPGMITRYADNPSAVNVLDSPYNYSCAGTCRTDVETFGTLPNPHPPVDSGNPVGIVNQITYVPGDLKLTSNFSNGAGILVVDGDLEISGGFQFFGLILVKGVISFTGGGKAATNISGAVLAGQQ
ncbi:MAG: hypothetical protein ACRD3R_00800, partial [Terriglobales bacterium]